MKRRTLLGGAAAAAGAALLGRIVPGEAQAPAGSTPPAVPTDPSAIPGGPTTPVSARSPFENPVRRPTGVLTGSAPAPLQDFEGTLFPSDLHFERHHGGVAMIDPARYKLMVHGLVDRELVFTLEDLRRFPAVSRAYFLECAGNGRAAYRQPVPEMTPQQIDGLLGSAEWTGVPVSVLLREAGVKRGGSWVLAEGGDSPKLSRSIPVEKMMDDALVVYAQNGEALRPAAGYPVRLLLPGWEGNTCVKWLRRLEVIDQPNMSRDETSRYTDPLPNDTARQFSFVMDAKSLITRPSHPMQLRARGWHPISGVAWSGRGRIARVDVSTDGGRSWMEAELQEPVLSKAVTRFRLMWEWKGTPATLLSRAVDDTGYVQPSLAQFREGRGRGTDFHFNAIRAWRVEADGRVFFAGDV